MFEDALNDIRKVAIESKKVAYIQTFKNLKKPHIEIAPRRNSIFDRRFPYESNSEAYQRLRHDKLKLNDALWSLIDECLNSFLPIHLAMMDFQSTKLSFIAALVLDPRFCFTSGYQLFNTEMLNRGITQLIKIHQKLCTQREHSNSLLTEEYIQLNALFIKYF